MLNTDWEEISIPALLPNQFDHGWIDDFLQVVIKNYPADPDFHNDMGDVWDYLSQAIGYKFEHEALGWSCRWRI